MWRYGDEGEGLVAFMGNWMRDNEFMKPEPEEDNLKLYNEYISLQKQISKDKIHETKSAENTKIIMRVKEIKAELKKRGYFR